MITSTKNQQVKYVQNLIKKGKARREEGVYVVEGLRICREIPEKEVITLYVTQAFLREHRAEAEFFRGYPCEMVSDDVMKAMADTQTPQGVLAVVRQKAWGLQDVTGGAGSQKEREKSRPACVMILENIQDPGNLGTILRAGEGAGVTGVIMDKNTVDIYNPKVIRSTMGSVFRMPFVCTGDLFGTLKNMKQNGIRLYAAHLEGKNSYDQEDFTCPCGFLIGNEANGLTKETAALADTYIRIPMLGQVESLNAAVAASVLMFEAARQRRGVRE